MMRQLHPRHQFRIHDHDVPHGIDLPLIERLIHSIRPESFQLMQSILELPHLLLREHKLPVIVHIADHAGRRLEA